WRCGEVLRLVAGIRRTPRADHAREVADARRLLAEAGRLQPSWGRVPFLAASLDDALDHPEDALQNYLRAFELGDRHEGLVARLAQLLCERRRFLDADRVVRQYEEAGGAVRAGLARLGADAALRTRDLGRAVALARRAVPDDARDHRDHLWLAH